MRTPRVLVRPVAEVASAGPWPTVSLDHGESPAAAAARAVREAGGPHVAVVGAREVVHSVDAEGDLLRLDLVVRPVDAPAGPVPGPDEHRGAVVFRRVAAYAVVVADDRLLLTQLSANTPVPGRWTLPGGGIDPGEAPEQALVREVYEETAHRAYGLQLTDVDSVHFVGRSPAGRLEDFHGIGIVYRAQVEQVLVPRVLDVGGSTAAAAWVPLDDLAQLPIGARAMARVARMLGRDDLAPGS